MCRDHVLLLPVLVVLLTLPGLQAQESSCCSKVTGSCRLACQKMSMVDIAVDPGAREMRLSHVKDFCPQQLEIFWDCLNKTIEEVLRGEEWSGRTCCPLPQSALCQQSCVTAASHKDLLKHCRHSDELAFFSCLEHQKAGDECCSGARTAPCKEACRSVFRSQATPSVEARVAVEEACGEASPRVLTCVHNHTKGTPALDPHKYVQCCEKASHGACRDACRRVLRSKTTDQEIVDSLQEAGCGPPMPHEKLWQCFLQKHEATEAADVDLSRIDRMGMDAAKLHCCPRASTPSCRRLCAKTFSNEWARHWDQFNSECLSQVTEDALVHCLDEVEEPCELGCEGLHYCSTFNNRPTELFRSCSRQADEAARYDVALWARQGSLPGLASFPVLDIASCAPRAWKTVACTLQIKPCHRHAHVNRICRQDCYELLSQCIDWSRMPPDHTAASLCSKLSPDSEDQPCISLKPFLQPSDRPHVAPQDGVTMPCKGVHPCNGSEVCVVNRNCAPGRPCQMYHCVPGCRLGEVSQYVVPKGTFVHIPVNSVGVKGCTKVCQCSGHGSLVHCEGLPCSHKDACWLGATKIDHNTWFYIECNLCSCFSGEITCSKRQCEVGDPAYTSLPCNCPPHYVPVCARNGNTYASACLAKCAGLSDAELEFGPCSAKDPCARHSCGRGQQCVPARRVCLAHTHKPCLQYQCVDNPADCALKPHDPVCDTEGQEHPNLCFLLDYWKTLAYKGPCLVNCDRRSVVCGFNGVTYRSECEAHADRVCVDYRGPCAAVGLLGGGTGPQSRCPDSGVRCPPLAQPDCVGLTPPGACCPICAGAVRFLYSHKQVDRAVYGSRGSQASLTVSSVLAALERHVQVSECSVRGYASVEAELVVVVQARDRPRPSALQLETCVREAEKLAALVRRGSPRVLSELSLSVLSNAVAIAHAPLVSAATPTSPSPRTFLLCAAVVFALRKLLC